MKATHPSQKLTEDENETQTHYRQEQRDGLRTQESSVTTSHLRMGRILQTCRFQELPHRDGQMATQTDTNVYMEELEETENARQESCQMRYQAVLGKNLRK